MLKGTYIYYEDGKEIYRSSNVITKYGKRFLTSFLAGRDSFSSKSMAFGIDSTAAADTDTRLGFEFYRVPVSFGSTDIQTANDTTTYAVVYKATMQAQSRLVPQEHLSLRLVPMMVEPQSPYLT